MVAGLDIPCSRALCKGAQTVSVEHGVDIGSEAFEAANTQVLKA